MKHVVSFSLDKETIFKLRDLLRNSSYRNKSHLVEEAIKKLARDKTAEDLISQIQIPQKGVYEDDN